ncbi:5-(carboxyamino)imidazole ribonucleotide synthase [Candidatus Parcubacteria bacterium]|nr:MAG: 5-(carboxyamino)imidazole ribonucleotide synthase [Candidatus Parcubacteria bacterium]
MQKRIGIVGGGQLGRMLAQAAKKLGFFVTVLDPTSKSPAGLVADAQITAGFKDESAIRELASKSDFLTFEIELANHEILHELAKDGVAVNPSAETLGIIKDKLRQKEFLREAGIPTADFAPVHSKEDVLHALKRFGYPVVLKARFDGYDGRGNALISSETDIGKGLEKLAGRLLYVEKFVPFAKELSVIIAREATNEIAPYPVFETVHKNNICHMVIALARVSSEARKLAEDVARRTMEELQGVGVFCVEMFLLENGEVFVNEIAPRVHNAGHLTIEAFRTSQFEQHIRAITGMKLGLVGMIVPAAVMVNILGDRTGRADPKGVERAEALPNVRVHLYDKIETRPERKMGHITATADTVDEAVKNAMLARSYVTI